ncbi:uncharacterized protein [Atheta coriaria]|uniref:uncharacterized protein n=1 Tax=Dalotia coriaria TaxID=877792 RepID=UPI0031F385AE
MPQRKKQTTDFCLPQWSTKDRLLADPKFAYPGKIDILLGSRDYSNIIKPGLEKKNGFICQETEFGEIISGGCSPTKSPIQCMVVEAADISNLHKFWELEEIKDEKKILSDDDNYFEEHYNKTTTRNPDGTYTVNLPFKEYPPQLGDSKQRAVARFLQVEKRLKQDSKLQELYHAFMREYLELGHMKKCSKEDEVKTAYYIPHHAVLKESSSTTKLRVVFDASCKTSNGSSLNDKLHTGPQLQQNIIDILLRWRNH